MEEGISRMAGSQHGVRLEIEELVEAAHRAGREAAQRNTSYEILQRFPDPLAPPDLLAGLADSATA